jgi:hypothetical protein
MKGVYGFSSQTDNVKFQPASGRTTCRSKICTKNDVPAQRSAYLGETLCEVQSHHRGALGLWGGRVGKQLACNGLAAKYSAPLKEQN